jgi:hydroxymethylglutaryl-CoA reductase
MSLHARQIAVSVGAVGIDVDRIASHMLREGQITAGRAQELLQQK